MKAVLVLLSSLILVSCNQDKQLPCNLDTFKKNNLKGKVVIFFSKPVSGSTYQMFLFPICETSISEILGKDSPQYQTFESFSFSLTSDDPRFKYLYERSQNLELVEGEPLAKNFQFIYYATCLVDLSGSEIENREDKTDQYTILTTGNKEIQFDYHFVPFIKFKIEM